MGSVKGTAGGVDTLPDMPSPALFRMPSELDAGFFAVPVRLRPLVILIRFVRKLFETEPECFQTIAIAGAEHLPIVVFCVTVHYCAY